MLLASAAACAGSSDASEHPPKPPSEVITVASEKLGAFSIDTVGTRRERVVAVLPAQVVMDEDHTVRVTPPVAGRIRTLDASPGMYVRAGQPLAHIASSDLAQAKSDLVKAEAALAQSTAALRRARDLYEHRVIAQKDLEQAQSDDAQARAEAERARTRVRILGSGSASVDGEFVLRAPISGDVLDRTANPGAEVRPDAGTTLFTISALDTLWLTANVYQRDLANVRPGSHLQFETDAVPGRRFDARITYVSGALDAQTHTALLRATLPNPGHVLKTLETGQARLYAPDRSATPVVPTRALVTSGTQTVVFVQVGPGRFVRRSVTVADDDGQFASIVSGLAPGDHVVVNGSLLLAAESEQVH